MAAADVLDLSSPADFARYGMSWEHGFLPGQEPLTRFTDSDTYEEYDEPVQDYLDTVDAFAAQVPDMVAASGLQHIRSAAHRLSTPPDESFYDELTDRELRRLYQATAFGASAYVHAVEQEPVDHIPYRLAVPLYESTDRLDVPPILSYDAYSLYNWVLKDPGKGITLDNVDTIQNFVDLSDEDWFMLVHVEIEDEAAPALRSIPQALRAVHGDQPHILGIALGRMRDAFAEMTATLGRMPDGNSPMNYADQFRPYIEKFDDIMYEGVDELDGPQSFRGETGAQSSIMPAMDRFLDVPHEETELTRHIDDMPPYMPSGHRRFLDDLAAAGAGDLVRDYVAAQDDDRLESLHDHVLWNMNAFRSLHNFYAHRYIGDHTDDPAGTGGTDYVQFLSQLIDETGDRMFRDAPDNSLAYTEDVLGENAFNRLMAKFAGR